MFIPMVEVQTAKDPLRMQRTKVLRLPQKAMGLPAPTAGIPMGTSLPLRQKVDRPIRLDKLHRRLEPSMCRRGAG